MIQLLTQFYDSAKPQKKKTKVIVKKKNLNDKRKNKHQF